MSPRPTCRRQCCIIDGAALGIILRIVRPSVLVESEELAGATKPRRAAARAAAVETPSWRSGVLTRPARSIIMIVFGFLLIFIPPCVIKDYHLGPYYLNGTARHSNDILNKEGATIDQVKDAWAKEKKRADAAEARFTTAEKNLAEARAELTLAETRGAEKA